MTFAAGVYTSIFGSAKQPINSHYAREMFAKIGSPAVWIHGPAEMRERGGTIAFNLVDDAGWLIDREHVVDEAAYAGICLRGGCFCNPGTAEHAFRYQAGELAAALDAVADHFSIAAKRVALNNKPVGAVAPRSATRARRATCRRSLPFSRTSPVVLVDTSDLKKLFGARRASD